jgi:hypothetical protein
MKLARAAMKRLCRSAPYAGWLVAAVLVAGCGSDSGYCLKGTWAKSLACEAKGEAGDDDAGRVEGEAPATGQPRGIPTSRVEDLPVSDSELANLSDIMARTGVDTLHARGKRGQDVTIAILDNGFAGLSHSVGVRLPPGLSVQPSPRPEQQETAHGVKLAEIAHAVATGSTRWDASRPGPRLLLFNANGFTNLKAAIDRVVELRPDIVLYAQVWEYGGNGDGTGFINREVRRATDAGVLWVNAAGNNGQAAWSGPVAIDSRGDVRLPHEGRYVRFSVPRSGTSVRIVLAWNDFDESKDYRTPQDLDLVLEKDSDGARETVGVSRLEQRGGVASGEASSPGESAHARETLQKTLAAGVYYLRVEAASRNFDAESRLRLTIDGAGVRLLDKPEGDSVLIPADNPAVLTVGASDVDYSGRSAASSPLHKPEVTITSEVAFDDGERHHGTSAASAVAAGFLAAAQSARGKLSRDRVLDLVEDGSLAEPLEPGCAAECPIAPRLRIKSD